VCLEGVILVTKEMFENAVKERFKPEYLIVTMNAITKFKYDEMWRDLRAQANEESSKNLMAETENEYS
jgi:hypothetical protein